MAAPDLLPPPPAPVDAAVTKHPLLILQNPSSLCPPPSSASSPLLVLLLLLFPVEDDTNCCLRTCGVSLRLVAVPLVGVDGEEGEEEGDREDISGSKVGSARVEEAIVT